MSARSARVSTLPLILDAPDSRAVIRDTARMVIPTATTARRATAAPIFTPMGRSANQPPERPEGEEVRSDMGAPGDGVVRRDGFGGNGGPFRGHVHAIPRRVAQHRPRNVGV